MALQFSTQRAQSHITVLLAHYNCVELLPRAIESIVSQSHPNWTCLVVDDASPSQQQLHQVRKTCSDSRVHWLRTSRNVGQFRIYNQLLPGIMSPYFILQDADDWSAPTRFERLLEELESTRCDVIGSALMQMSLQGDPLKVVRPPTNVNQALAWRFRRAVFFGATMLCCTEFMRRMAGYDGTTHFAADSDFVYRAVFEGWVRNHPEPLYFYTQRPDSLTQSHTTGFGSPARVHYAKRIRRRFYRHLLSSRLLRARSLSLSPPPNDVEFDILALE